MWCLYQAGARSRDDLDMEQALKPRGMSTPDVIKSALDKNDDSKINSRAIDRLFGVPDKIVIPERYMPDAVSRISGSSLASSKYFFNFQEDPVEEFTPEERKVRLQKADSIRRMLAEQSAVNNSGNTGAIFETLERFE